MINRKVELGEYAELATSLRAEASPDTLYHSAQRLLANCGVESTIDFLPAVVTKWYFETALEGQPLYARIGRLHAKKGAEQLPLIVFDETKNLPVVTGNYLALAFQTFGDRVSLLTQNNVNPLLDDLRYLALAQKVIRGIAAEDVRAREAAKVQWDNRLDTIKSVGSHVRHYFTDKRPDYYRPFSNSMERGKVRRAGAASLMLMYAHLLGGDVDAHIGPLPMPQPIEAIVDLANQEAHAAQGFREPKGAVQLEVGKKDGQLPLLDTYDTRGVPDATDTTRRGSTAPFVYTYKEVSRPGLYRVNYLVPLAPGKAGNPYCFTVYGNYRSGKSSVFTQDADTVANLRLEVKNTEELEACIVAGENPVIKGSFYIWQDK